MKFFKKYKTLILIVGAVIIAAVAYTIFFGGEDDSLLVAEPQDNAASVEESNLLTLLLDLRSVKLNDTLFSDPVFKSLEDFGQELTAEPVGRENPFAPIGSTE
ncbi:MAG: hypothetical protein ACE5F2_01885 [Candidatus Paceibacteria bacterium]